MNYRIGIMVAAVIILSGLTLAFPSWDVGDHTRWIVPIHSEAQATGILRAAAARGCEEHIRTDRFISFNCPQGSPRHQRRRQPLSTCSTTLRRTS